MLYCIMPCDIILYDAMLCYSILCHIEIVMYYTILYDITILYDAILYDIMLCHTLLHNTALLYHDTCYVLHYAILYYVMP